MFRRRNTEPNLSLGIGLHSLVHMCVRTTGTNHITGRRSRLDSYDLWPYSSCPFFLLLDLNLQYSVQANEYIFIITCIILRVNQQTPCFLKKEGPFAVNLSNGVQCIKGTLTPLPVDDLIGSKMNKTTSSSFHYLLVLNSVKPLHFPHMQLTHQKMN